MLRETGGVSFDRSRCLNQELTFIYTDDFFSRNDILFGEQQKRTLGLIDSDGYYTNTAFLLSDQCEHSIKCAVFEGEGKTRFKTRKEFSGSVLKQMDEAYDFISINNNLNTTFDGLQRVEHPDYPEFALREALINAIVHRDYDYSGSIIVNIFDNRMEFVSLGGLVKGITLDDVENGISQSRNTVLANVFYRLKLIESYGTGIRRIIEAYQNQAVHPQFSVAPASFALTLPKFSQTDGTALPEKEKILELLRIKDMCTRKDVETQLGCSKSNALKLLNELVSDGLIEKNGEARSVSYRKK